MLRNWRRSQKGEVSKETLLEGSDALRVLLRVSVIELFYTIIVSMVFYRLWRMCPEKTKVRRINDFGKSLLVQFFASMLDQLNEWVGTECGRSLNEGII